MVEDDRKYAELAANMRFYGDMRFKQLTLLLTGMTLLVAGVAQYPTVDLFPSVPLRGALAVAGMLFTGVMWIMEVRSTISFFANRAQAKILWPHWEPRFLKA